MLLKMGSRDNPLTKEKEKMKKLAKGLRKKRKMREGVRENGLYGFPTLTKDYVR